MTNRSSWTDRLFPVFVREGRSRKRYKAGYINCLGEIVLPAEFEEAYPFRNGLASVKQGGRWGAINSNGDFVIPPASGGPLIFSEGLAQFSTGDPKDGDRRGLISATGEIIVKPRYRSISNFNGGLACVYDGKLYGYIDRNGNQVIPPFFEDARGFSEGVAAVKVGTGEAHRSIADACEVGFIDRAGEFVITPRFFSTGSFQDGLCFVETEKEILYVDHHGTPVWSSGWVELGGFDPYHLLPAHE